MPDKILIADLLCNDRGEGKEGKFGFQVNNLVDCRVALLLAKTGVNISLVGRDCYSDVFYVFASGGEAIHSSKNATGTKKVLKQMNAVQKAQHGGKWANTSRTAKTGVLR